MEWCGKGGREERAARRRSKLLDGNLVGEREEHGNGRGEKGLGHKKVREKVELDPSSSCRFWAEGSATLAQLMAKVSLVIHYIKERARAAHAAKLPAGEICKAARARSRNEYFIIIPRKAPQIPQGGSDVHSGGPTLSPRTRQLGLYRPFLLGTARKIVAKRA